MPDDDRGLRAAVEAWFRALDAEDAEALGALTAPEAVFLAPGRPPAEGREAWLQGRSPRLAGVELHCRIERLVVYGDRGCAWYEVALRVPGEAGEPDVRVEGHTMAFYRRDGAGKWLRTHEAAMLAPARG